MPQVLFYIFALLSAAGAISMIVNRNPVASALSMVGTFVGMAALFVGLNAYLVGTMQILVYGGAIMVLFIFIIMLLDLKAGERRPLKTASVIAAGVIPALLLIQITGVLGKSNSQKLPELDFKAAASVRAEGHTQDLLAEERLPDTRLIGESLFGSGEKAGYNLPLQIIGVLLLVATVGVVVLSKRSTQGAAPSNPLTKESE